LTVQKKGSPFRYLMNPDGGATLQMTGISAKVLTGVTLQMIGISHSRDTGATLQMVRIWQSLDRGDSTLQMISILI
jgi:hypothetical protein